MAVLLVSSEIEEVLGLAHRVLVMRRGRIVAEFDGRTGGEDDVLRAAFGNRRRRGRRCDTRPEEVALPERRRARVGPGSSWLRDYGIVASFVALFLALSLASDVFLTWTNLVNVLDQWAPVGIMACAATLVIIAGGFDLSVGAIFAVAGITAAKVANATSPGSASSRASASPSGSASATASCARSDASTRSLGRWRRAS